MDAGVQGGDDEASGSDGQPEKSLWERRISLPPFPKCTAKGTALWGTNPKALPFCSPSFETASRNKLQLLAKQDAHTKLALNAYVGSAFHSFPMSSIQHWHIHFAVWEPVPVPLPVATTGK